MRTHVTIMLLLTIACGGSEDVVIDAAVAGDARADAAIDAPPAPKRVFVTSIQYASGNLKTIGAGTDGLDGADKLCTARATAASLTGQWIAFLSTTTTNAIDRVTEGPRYRVDGTTLVFASKAAIASGPLVGILVDENGGTTFGYSAVWTGTSPAGTATASTCLDWTSGANANSGTEGLRMETDDSWTSYIAAPCNLAMARLYCFEK